MTIDPITTEVIASRFREISATMEHALYHSGYSPILRESKDGSAGLTDPTGRVMVVGGGIQFHFMTYQFAVQSVLARVPAGELKPGQSFVGNDPYRIGAAHVPDLVAVTPAFHQGQLIGFAVSIAHKADVGGIVPGSSGAASREIFHDGLLLPPVLYQTEEGVNQDIEAIIANNSRVPEVVLGDLRAQVGCTRLGVKRFADLCDEYGQDTIRASIDTLLMLSARRVKAEIASWPDGVFEREGFLDHDGAEIDKPVRIHVRAEKAGDRLTLDFSGSSPQTLGPVNLIKPTSQAAALMAVLAIVDPTIPVNTGLREAVDFVMPEGQVVNPQHPATVNHYMPTAHVVYNCVLSALCNFNPRRAVAPSGFGAGAISIGYKKSRNGKPTVLYELFAIAQGGNNAADGTVMVQPMNNFTPGAPIEIAESEYPIRILRFDIRPDSAGPGRNRGGIGYIREMEVLQGSVLTVRSANHRFAAWGWEGGSSPLPARAILNPGRENEELGPIVTRHLKSGDVIRFERSGGAGFGLPKDRSPEAVREDIKNGYLSEAMALKIYGIKPI